MKLTDAQKQELLDLYWDDFYVMNIIDWFAENYLKDYKRALKHTLRSRKISWRKWRKICKACERFDTEASEICDDVAQDTMWSLLEKAQVDPYKPFNMATAN